MIKSIALDSGLVFDHGEHIYYHAKTQVPSPTMLFSEEELCDLSDVPEDRLVWKAGLGKAVHFACHLLDINDLGAIDDQIKPYLEAYKKFKADTGFIPAYSEQILYSKKWRYATTLDRQGFFSWKGKSGESIIELKCTASMFPTVGPQTASHQIAFEEVAGIKIKYRYAVQLLKTADYKVHEYSDPQDHTTFLSALHLHHWKVKHRIIKPRRME